MSSNLTHAAGHRRITGRSFAVTLGLAATLPPAALAQHADRVRYTIEARLTNEADAIAARATIRLPRSALPDPDTVRLGLRLSGGRRIDISAVGDSAGNTRAFFLHGDSSTAILPLLPGGATAAFMVEYTVAFDSATRRSLGYALVQSTTDADAWYPELLDLADSLRRFRDFDVGIETPRGLAVLASGALVDTVPSDHGTTLHRYQAREVEGVALAAGPRHRVVTVATPTAIARAFAPDTAVARYRRIAAATADAMTWYRGTYQPFPAAEIGVVPGYLRARGGFPLPHVFMIHRGDLSTDFIRWITAHELAHYYWGLSVLDPEGRLGWLTLGLGIWTDQLYLARVTGRPLAAQWRDVHGDNSFEDYATAMATGHDQRLGLPATETDSLSWDYNTLVRHGKAATGIYLLARRIGTERFIELQRDLLSSHRSRTLTIPDFAAAAERAGAPGALDFLDAWARGDARVEYVARGVRPDAGVPDRWWIRVERTGTVSAPVTVEARGASGAPVRAVVSGSARLDSVRVTLAGRPVEVLLDPDGELPMRTSDNTEMRRVFLRAAGRVAPVDSFLTAARAHLRRDPDPYVAALVIERLFEAGRYGPVYETAVRYPEAVRCLDRRRCFAALQVARALARQGKRPGAVAWLRNLRPAMAQLGIGPSSRLVDAERDVEGPAADRRPGRR